MEYLFPQVLAGAVASTYKDGCTYLRERLQVLASEMGKRGTEIASPILDNYCPLNFLELTKKLWADSFLQESAQNSYIGVGMQTSNNNE